MTAIRRVLLGVLMLLSYSACAEPLSLLSRAADSSVALTLTAAQRQWLHQNAVLRVGVYLPDRPPLDITDNQKDYEGLSADYLDVLARGLGVRLQVNLRCGCGCQPLH